MARAARGASQGRLAIGSVVAELIGRVVGVPLAAAHARGLAILGTGHVRNEGIDLSQALDVLVAPQVGAVALAWGNHL